MSRIVLVLGPSTGGIGKHVSGLAARASHVGHEVWVAGPRATLSLFGLDDAHWGHIDLSAKRGLGELRRLIEQSNLVHAHGLRAATQAGIASPWRTPMLATWHNQRRSGEPKSVLDRVTERYVARRADLNLCVSVDLVDTVVGHKGRARLSPLGPATLASPTRSRARTRALMNVPHGSKLVLSVSRLAEQKGLDVLIEAASGLPFDAVLAIAGTGPLEAQLREQASSANVKVRWLGQRSDLADLYIAADVLAMPSRWEGSPFALHEAFQAGCPVVASAVGGIPKLVGTAASLVPPDDHLALRRALTDVLMNGELAALLAEGGVLALRLWPDEAAACDAVLETYDAFLRQTS